MLSFLQSKGGPSKKRIVFLLVMALFLISGALLFNAPEQTQVINVNFPSGGVLKAEVADTPEKLLFGLAFRNVLPPDEGMIYIFEDSGLHRVWTKEFQFPVDVIWVDESKIVVHIVERAPPCNESQCPWYGPPPQDARYIVEANAGFVDQAKVQLGAQVTFTLLVS
ncbi:MAG: hypothetical protein NPIRA03_15780 [Nitrospirales bacterium]|nr:MAG: hypothetical protein NPIRA03_15780 [Nitrospirales bacterium]